MRTLHLLSGVVDVSVEPDDGDVIVEVTRVELLVEEDVGGVVLHVGVELGIVVHVPLAESDPVGGRGFVSLGFTPTSLGCKTSTRCPWPFLPLSRQVQLRGSGENWLEAAKRLLNASSALGALEALYHNPYEASGLLSHRGSLQGRTMILLWGC